MTMRAAGIFLGMTLLAMPAFAADLPGSRDPAGLKRFAGAEIVDYVTRSYDTYVLARGNGTPGTGFAKSETVTGQVTRVIYRIPKGHTGLEALRNYQNMLKAAGYTQTFEVAPCTGGTLTWNGYFYDKFFYQSSANRENPFKSTSANGCYTSFRSTQGGKTTDVAVLVAEAPTAFAMMPNGVTDPKKAIRILPGEMLVGVDMVVGQPAPNAMVPGR